MEGTVPSAPAAVWAALAEPGKWWVRDAKVEFRAGGRYVMNGTIAALEPERRLSVLIPVRTPNVSFDTTLEVRLTPDGTGTRVSFEHTGPGVMAWMGETRELERGWRETLVKLANYLKGVR